AEPVVVDRYVAGVAPLVQRNDSWTGGLGLTLNRDLGAWRLSLTSGYTHADAQTQTGTGLDASALQAALNADSPSVDPFGTLPASLLHASPLNTARSVTDNGNLQLLLVGPLAKLPAGALFASAKLGDTASASEARPTIAGVTQHASLSRNVV